MLKGDQFLARHIVEIRLDDRLFSFVDFKGSLIDFLAREAGIKKIKLQEQRIDVATEDLHKSMFFSWENLGFQLEASADFDSFHKQIDEFFSLIRKFQKFTIGSIVRVGTRSIIFYHRKGQSFDGIKNKLRERLIKEPDTLEKKVGLPIGDVAFVTEHKSEKYDTNIEWAPMTFTEVMNKVFGDKRAAYRDTFKDDYSGLFLSMDVFQTNGLNMDAEQLIKRIHENANVIEKQMESLVSYCLEQDEK